MNFTNFKSIAVGLALLGIFATTGPATAERGKRGGKKNPQRMIQRLSQKLDLSESQVAQVKSIFESRKTRFQELRQQMRSTFSEDQRAALKEMRRNRRAGGERPSKEERRAKMQELGVSQEQMQQMRSLRKEMRAERKDVRAQIASVLTPEQRSEFEQMKRKRGKRGQRGRRGGQQEG